MAVSPALRVIALTPGTAELMYAAGAGDLLVAAVDYSDYPDVARSLPRVGDAFRVDMERVLALKPDLILAGGSFTPRTTVEQLTALGLHVEDVEAHQMEEVATALRHLGQLTHREVAADQAAQQFREHIAEWRSRYQPAQHVSVFIQISAEPLYTVNGQHILSEAVSLCGGDNVFADLNLLAPVISTEAVLKRNPQVILAATQDASALRTQWQRWTQLPAVHRDQLYAVSPDAATRATPRLLDAIAGICHALDGARANLASH